MTRDLARSFPRDNSGAISVEFVVVFPLLVLLLMLIVFVSLLISTASDVQQITHEMARASFKYLGDSSITNICAKLRSDVLPHMLENSALLSVDRFTLLDCPGQPDASGFITITARYDFAGSIVQSIGEMFNFDLGLITRSSRIKP